MKIVVLAGGTSTERDVSIVSGTGICTALRQKGHQAVLVDIFCVTDLGLNVSLLSAAALIGVATISANSFLFSSRSQIKGITTAVA